MKKKHEKKSKCVEEEEETYTANLYITKWLTTVHLVFISTNNAIYIYIYYIHTAKYADDLVLLAKEEKVLHDMINKLIEIGRCYGMEMNVEKTKVMRISRQPSPVKIMINQKQLENVESFKY